MSNLAYNHIGTYKAGSFSHAQHMADRFNGESMVRIDYDSSLYVYDNSRERKASAREWKAFIKEAWQRHGQVTIEGRFPFYTVSTFN